METTEKKPLYKKALKYIGFFFLGLIAFFLIFASGLAIYFNKNKTEIVAQINQQINDNIKGSVVIGDVDYSLIKGLSNFALVLNKVTVKDSLWEQHKQTLLKAGQIEVHLNLRRLLLSKEVEVNSIKINDAIIHLYVDKNGCNNSDIFRPKPKDTIAKPKKKITIEGIGLENIEFISENIQQDKLFDFKVHELKSKIKYNSSGWETDLFINTLAKSMAFKLSKGSFIKNKVVKGTLALNYSKAENKIHIVTKKLGIGDDSFDITANFSLDKEKPLFDLDINTEILWNNAAHLLDAHIYKILNHFDIKKPIKANCKINGNTSVAGDPVIVVKAIIKDNELVTPDGSFNDCSFNGEYNNTYKKGLETSDENSAVILTNFSAKYKTIPFTIPQAMVYNLTVPTLTGDFHSKFEVDKLNQFLNPILMTISEGIADVNLKFNVNMAQFKINKPLFSGNVFVSKATLNYVSKNISFKKTDILLNFTEKDLNVDKITFVNKDNTVFLKGKIVNFLEAYYSTSGKTVINWDITATNFNAQQFIAMLSTNKKTTTQKATPKKASQKMVSSKLQSMIDDSEVNINIKADKMTYKNLKASDFTTLIQLNNGQLFVKNGFIKTCNGSVAFEAQLIPQNNLYNFDATANIKTVAIPEFLTAFDNFGITSFQPNNIKGDLTLNTTIKGSITQNGDLVKNSLIGNVKYQISNGELNNFTPIIKAGKVGFPKRNVKNIDIENLNGQFEVSGELVTLDLFKVSSTVLNFDVGGIYSFGKGTNLLMTIPLRDPADDHLITNAAERESMRYKGIVVNLKAIDGSDGNIQIKLNPQNVKISSPFNNSKNKEK